MQIPYQYATFAEIEAVSKHDETLIILNYSTDPGYPITIVSEQGVTDPRKSAYRAFYKEMSWSDANKYDAIYVLNVLGRLG
jgi:hypothetical protein